jgi:hypothetical protein
MKIYYSNPEKVKSFDFQKKDDKLPHNFKLHFKKSKIIHTDSSNSLHSHRDIIKGGIIFGSKREVPVKMKENKLFRDTQKNIMDLNIIKNYHRVFKNEAKQIYTNEYIKNVSKLLYKNEKNYFTKKKTLIVSKKNLGISKIRKNSFCYITQFGDRNSDAKDEFLEQRKKLHINNLKFLKKEKSLDVDDDKYTLNDTYDSNESIQFTNSQFGRLKNNLDEKYNFYRVYETGKKKDLIYKENTKMVKHKDKLPLIIHRPQKSINNIRLKTSKTPSKDEPTRMNTSLIKNKSKIVIDKNSEGKIKKLLNNLQNLREKKLENLLSDYDDYINSS